MREQFIKLVIFKKTRICTLNFIPPSGDTFIAESEYNQIWSIRIKQDLNIFSPYRLGHICISSELSSLKATTILNRVSNYSAFLILGAIEILEN